MEEQCHGNGKEHCCWFDGKVCPFLEIGTVPGRQWVCGLYREHGDWNKVHSDPRYIESVAPSLEPKGISCGGWPWCLGEEFMLNSNPSAKCCFGGENPPVYNVGVAD